MLEALTRGGRGHAAVQNVGSTERLVSAAAGGALVLRALRHPSLLNAMLALGGAALLKRGISGHCGIYEKLGIDHSGKGERREAWPGETYGTGRRSDAWRHDEIEAASDHSFPASDPPAWTLTSAVGRPSRE